MPLFAFDLETHLIRPGCLTPRVVCGSWADATSKGIGDREEAFRILESCLLDPDTEICGSNIAYDFGCSAAMCPDLLPLIFKAYNEGRVFDTLIAQALIDVAYGILFTDPVTRQPFDRYSQGRLEKQYLQIDRSDQKVTTKTANPDAEPKGNVWRLRYGELDGIPLSQWPEAALKYPQDDARYCYDIAVKQKAKGTNLDQMAEQACAAWALHLSAIWGMRTDLNMVADVVRKVHLAHAETLEKFKAIGFMHEVKGEIKVNNPELRRRVAIAYGVPKDSKCPKCGGTGKDISEKTGNPIQCAICSATGLDIIQAPVPLTDTGEICKDRDALEESGDDDLEAYAKAGANETLFKNFLPVLGQGLDVPINPETNVLVSTGRSSYRGAIRQNFPRKGGIRDCFRPRDGFWFASIDYGTLELCTLAQTCILWVGSSQMADAINRGEDLHDLLASSIRALTYEEQHAQRKAGDKTAKNFRQLSKAANFGLPGGLGAETFVTYARQSYDARLCILAGRADTCGVTKVIGKRSGRPICSECLDVAEGLRRLWFSQWPEVAEYHKIVSMMVETGDGQIQVPGPGTDYGILRGGCSFCDGANNAFQGLAARGAKAALYAVSEECYTDSTSALYGSRPVIFIHDEILLEVPMDRAHEAAYRCSDVMVQVMRYYVPDVKIMAEPALMRTWLKGAEPAFDANGRLIPWEPKTEVK